MSCQPVVSSLSAPVILIPHVKNQMMPLGSVTLYQESLTKSFLAVETKGVEDIIRLQTARVSFCQSKRWVQLERKGGKHYKGGDNISPSYLRSGWKRQDITLDP